MRIFPPTPSYGGQTTAPARAVGCGIFGLYPERPVYSGQMQPTRSCAKGIVGLLFPEPPAYSRPPDEHGLVPVGACVPPPEARRRW